ncbi:PAS domain S-box protein [bacterium]|nr:PAS domain S-box protein [candidate division CSSED10-310 bacterium]
MTNIRDDQSGSESVDFYAEIVDQAREFIITLSPEGKIRYVNQYSVTVSGRSYQDWIGRSLDPIILPGDVVMMRNRLNRVRRGESVSMELRIWGPNNHVIWLHVEAMPVFDGGTLRHILCFARDITQQKMVESALRESERNFRDISTLLEGTFNSIPDVIGIQDLDHRIVRYNSAGYSFLGLTPDQADGKRCFELIGWQSPCDVCATQACYEKKQPTHVEKYVKEMGIWLDARAYPVLDENGNLKYVIEHVRDITRQKSTEKAIRSFKHAVDGSTDAICMLIFEGSHWYQNQAFSAFFGYYDSDAINHIFARKDDADAVRTALDSGKEYYGELAMRDLHGRLINMLVRAYPIREDNEEVIGIVGVHTDISYRKEAEKRLRESEAHYRSIYETSQAGFWQTRKSDGKFIRANLTTARYLGYESLDDFLQNCNSTAFYKNPGERKRLLSELEAHGCVREFVTQFQLPDGSCRDLMISARDFPDDGYVEGVVFDISAQKQAEEALVALEEDLRTTLDSIGDAVIATDHRGRIVRINPVAEKLTGYSINSSRGKTLKDIYRVADPDTGDMIADPVARILTGEESAPFPAEPMLITQDGQHRQIAESSAPIRNSSGQVTGVVVVFRDVTEDVRIRRNLEESEERFRNLAELLPVGVFESDLSVNLSFVNTTALSMFGYSLEDFQRGLNGLSLFTPESRVRAHDNLTRRLKGENIRGVEYACQRRNGTIFPALFYIKPVLSTSGEPMGLRGVIIDITDQKRVEEYLRESEEFSSSLLRNSPHPIVVMEPDLSLNFVNPAFEELTGYPAAGVTGLRPPFPWWDPDHHPETEERFHRLLSGETKGLEELFRKKDGSRFWVEMSSSRTFREDGSLKYYICSWVETTERKQMEERLRKLSLHDSLTNLYNRAVFEEEMERFRTDRQWPVSIVVCDIDGLKLINETMGHQTGDELLQAAAEILRCSFRQSDVISRIGGDEFAIILPKTTAQVTRTCCERIRNQVREYNQLEHNFYLSISVGYAVSEEMHVDLGELFKIADHNMYREKLQQSHSSRSDIVQALIKTMEARDYITDGHAERMRELATGFGQRLGFQDGRLNDLKLLCRFHDLGKVGVSDCIIFKPGPLTSEEFDTIKTHCEIGYRIALSIPDLAPIADFILKHHEWWNGQGYPLGLKGEEIPIESRILSIVDSFDAMTNERPYKHAMSRKAAIQELERCAGHQFDPTLLTQFVAMIRENGQ